MFRFILGLIVGAVAAIYFMRSEHARELELDTKLEQFQERANSAIGEMRRLLEETRKQIEQMTETVRERGMTTE